jgi:hypothetical protein
MEIFNAIWAQFGGLITFFAYAYVVWMVIVGGIAIAIFIFVFRQFLDMRKGFDSNFFKRNRR